MKMGSSGMGWDPNTVIRVDASPLHRRLCAGHLQSQVGWEGQDPHQDQL